MQVSDTRTPRSRDEESVIVFLNETPIVWTGVQEHRLFYTSSAAGGSKGNVIK